MSFRTLTLVVASLFTAQALAESHTVTFTNNCGSGTPKLVQNGKVLNNGNSFTSNGPLKAAIAYLDQGNCGLDGENCSIVEMTLQDRGAGSSSADISLISPHTFNVGAGFNFSGSGSSCGGGACAGADCNTAFHQSDQTCVQVGCSANDAGLDITFCGVQTGFTDPSHPTVPCN